MALSNNICRCCMIEDNNEGNIELLSIFSKLQDTITLKELLKEAIPRLKISEVDNLPKKVCTNCLEAVKEIYQFQQNCVKNEAKFCEMLMVKKEQSQAEFNDSSEAYFEDIITKLDAAASPLADDDFAREASSPAFEDLKLNIDKIEKGLDSDEEFVASCSDFSEEIENESDDEEFLVKRKRKSLKQATKNKTKKAVAKRKPGKAKTAGETVQVVPNIDMDLELHTDVEDIIESDFSLDLGDSDMEVDIKVKKEKESKTSKILQSLLYTCDKCDKTFRTPSALNRHLDWHKKLTCDICGEEFLHRELHRAHKKLHTSNETHLCSECGKCFATATNLKEHLQRHLNDKQYTCKHCPKSFRVKADLYSHIRVHNVNIKMHTCDECGQSFSRAFLLKQHRLRHTNVKNFQCEFCDKRFLLNEQLQRHRRIHTGEKPYKCKFCERAYVQSNDLIKHLRTHLGENVYQCELCPQRLPTAKACREHFTSHKNDDEATRLQLLAQLNALEVKGLFCK